MEDTLVDVQGMYYNNQSILYVGEGDFSFSSSHATRFSVANNIVATSLDSRDVLRKNYDMDALQNIKNLTDRGAQVIHAVNACNMAEKDGSLPSLLRYDVVNYNFPHAGFFGKEDDPDVIRKHTELMRGFFRNAALLLAPGGVVYVAHKCGPPYDDWNLEENATMHGLQYVGSVPFQKKHFPGYKNRRGSGKRAGETFQLGQAAIYIFALRYRVWIENIEGLQTPNKESHLHLHILKELRSFIEGGRASSMLQAIASLENEKLGPEKQIKLNSLKVVVKVVPMLLNVLPIHQIQSFPPSKSYTSLAKSWRKIQKLALQVMELDEQNIEPEKLERDMKKEQEVMEIYVSDDIANGTLGEENEEAISAFVLDTPMPCSMKTDPTGDLGEVYFPHESQRCDDNQSDMGPGLKVVGVSSGDVEEDVENNRDGTLEADSLGKRIIKWVIKKIICCRISNSGSKGTTCRL